jgi:hypothetical protein
VLESTQVAEVRIVVVPVFEPRFDHGWLGENACAWDLGSHALVQLRQWVHGYLDARMIQAVD